MKEPIFVYEPVDLDVFLTLSDAERYLEPPEIESNSLLFFDAQGRVLSAKVVGSNDTKRIVIIDENAGANPNFLRGLIVDFLESLNYSRSELECKNLPSLVQESLKYSTR